MQADQLPLGTRYRVSLVTRAGRHARAELAARLGRVCADNPKLTRVDASGEYTLDAVVIPTDEYETLAALLTQLQGNPRALKTQSAQRLLARFARTP